MTRRAAPTFSVGIFRWPHQPLEPQQLRFLGLHADEVIVLMYDIEDTASRGQYENIQFETFAWSDSLADAKNHLIEQLTGDFVLLLDVDEEIDFGTLKHIRSLMGDAARPVEQVCCVCVDTYEDDIVVDRIYQPRFWARRLDLKFVGRIIEEVEIREQLKFDYDDEFIVRCRPQNYADEIVARHEALTETLYQLEMDEAQNADRVLYHQGVRLLIIEDYEQARATFETLIDTASHPDRRASAHLMLCECLRKLDRADEGYARGLAVVKEMPDYGDLWFYLGRAALETDRRIRAEAAFLHARKVPTDHTPLLFRDPTIQTWQAEVGQSLALACLNEIEKADALMQQVSVKIPDYVRWTVDRDFIDIWLKLDQPERAWLVLEPWLVTPEDWSLNSFLSLCEYVFHAQGANAAYALFQKTTLAYGGLLEFSTFVLSGAALAASVGDEDAQLDLLSHGAEIGFDSLEPYLELSRMLVLRGRLDDAREIAEKARQFRDNQV
ncbi:MAG: hypothetical protein VX589_15105 [Myxococcota bacterium]|nr:hypothetical protein [Myxococcota bacterium]